LTASAWGCLGSEQNLAHWCVAKAMSGLDDSPVVEMSIKFWAVLVTTQKLAGSSRCQFAFDILAMETQFLKNAVNEVGLSEVDCAIWMPLDVDSQEV